MKIANNHETHEHQENRQTQNHHTQNRRSKKKPRVGLLATAFLASALCVPLLSAQEPAENMSFFVTSSNPGNGGDLGGIEGADAHCQSLAEAVGAGDKTWRAYLSTSSEDARDRIGNGPWHNVRGELIAEDLEQLHGENNITGETALTEQGTAPNYLAGDPPTPVAQPLEHDILTGTNEDGTAHELTCNGWTDGTADAQAMVGHSDRLGRTPGVNSWNAVHASQGCSMENFVATGGAGMFYCFAID